MKRLNQILILLLAVELLTGCGCSKKEEKNEKPKYDKDASVVKDQIFTGLEFVNIGIDGEKIMTEVINNTGVVYESSTFMIRIKDEQNNVIGEYKGKIDSSIKNGETRVVTTKANVDLAKAYSIEYSVD